MAVLNREDYKTAIPQLSKTIDRIEQNMAQNEKDFSTQNIRIDSVTSLGGYGATTWVDLSNDELNVDGLTTSDTSSDWMKSAIKAICARYPHRKNHLFRGFLKPNSFGYFEVFIYDTDMLSGGLPQYCLGTYRQYSSAFNKYFTNNYAWTFTNIDTTYENATTTTAGLMSAADKVKLNGIEAGAEVNTVTGVKGSSEADYRTGNVSISAANVGAVPTSRTVNGHALSANVTIDASDIGITKKTQISGTFKASAANAWEYTGTSVTVPSNHVYLVRAQLGYSSGRPIGVGFNTSTTIGTSGYPNPYFANSDGINTAPVFMLYTGTHYLFEKRATVPSSNNTHWIDIVDITL